MGQAEISLELIEFQQRLTYKRNVFNRKAFEIFLSFYNEYHLRGLELLVSDGHYEPEKLIAFFTVNQGSIHLMAEKLGLR